MKISLNELVMMFGNTPGVYKIYNTVNGDYYIGSSTKLIERLKRHEYLLRTGSHNNLHLQRAYNKYGEENFKFEILEECCEEKVLIREQYYIDKLRPIYNLCPYAGNTRNRVVTEQTKQKISKAFKGEKHPFYGKKMPKEWIDKAQATKRASGYKIKQRIDKGVHKPELGKQVLCLDLQTGVYSIYPSVVETEIIFGINKGTLRASLKRNGTLRQYQHLNFSYYED